MPKTRWEKHKNYHSQIIYIENNQIIYKDYWDPGKNPNVTEISFDEFLSGKWDYKIIMEFEPWILKEIKESIAKIREI